MKTAIVYASVHHGNTKKIIDEIANIKGYMNANMKEYMNANMNEANQNICKQQIM